MNDPSMEFSGDSDSDKTLNYWSSSASSESSDSDLKENNVNPSILRRDECKLRPTNVNCVKSVSVLISALRYF